MKTCTKCGEERLLGDFYSEGRQCKPCRRTSRLAKYRALTGEDKVKDTQRRREYQLMRKYGLTMEERGVLETSQEGLCAICGKEGLRLVVDHDHATGDIRGLLCNGCNTGLGMLQDDRKVLQSAVDYLTTRRREIV